MPKTAKPATPIDELPIRARHLILRWQKLPHYIAVGMARRGALGKLSLEDAEQAGWFGLRDAAERFEPALGFTFFTHARWWVRQAIQQEQFRAHIVRVPNRFSLRRPGSARRRGAAEAAQKVSSLPFDLEGPGLEPSAAAEQAEARQAVALALRKLRDREQQVLDARFFRGESGTEIARQLGISREGVRLIQLRAMTHLRHLLTRGQEPEAEREARLEENRVSCNRMRRLRAERRAQGLCVYCGDRPPMPGNARCPPCWLKHKKNSSPKRRPVPGDNGGNAQAADGGEPIVNTSQANT